MQRWLRNVPEEWMMEEDEQTQEIYQELEEDPGELMNQDLEKDLEEQDHNALMENFAGMYPAKEEFIKVEVQSESVDFDDPTLPYIVAPKAPTSKYIREKRKMQCDQCEYSCMHPENLRRHRRSKHLGISFPCDECGFSSSTRRYLTQHKERKHGGIKYPCDDCDYIGTSIYNLKVHKETKHEGIRYQCETCGYAATTPGSLKRHIDTKHIGIKYPCDECEYAAPRKDDLKKHKRRKHTEINMYSTLPVTSVN